MSENRIVFVPEDFHYSGIDIDGTKYIKCECAANVANRLSSTKYSLGEVCKHPYERPHHTKGIKVYGEGVGGGKSAVWTMNGPDKSHTHTAMLYNIKEIPADDIKFEILKVLNDSSYASHYALEKIREIIEKGLK